MNPTAHLTIDRDTRGKFSGSHEQREDARHVDPRLEVVLVAGWTHGPEGWWHPVLGMGGGKLGGLEMAYSTTCRYRHRWAELLAIGADNKCRTTEVECYNLDLHKNAGPALATPAGPPERNSDALP